MFKINNTFAKYLLLFYWLLLVFLTSLPSEGIPQPGISDKFAHYFAYFGLSFLVFFYWFNYNFKLKIKLSEVKIITILIAYGLFDEIHQIFIPGRSCEFFDFLADALGTLSAYYFIKFIINRRVNAKRIKKNY